MFWKIVNSAMEKNKIPDALLRAGIRRLNKLRLKMEKKENCEAQQEHFMRLVEYLKSSPVAVDTDKANEQHYEVPAEFYDLALGKHKKYSSCYYPTGKETLDQAEEIMLNMTTERAQLKDGLKILELGCGWGSLTMYMAAKYPKSKITAVSNSASQKKYIDSQCKERGLKNVKIITADMNKFKTTEKFDRIVSVEMFEHMRNYASLFKKIAGFLKPSGKMFVHIFTHKDYAYLFEDKDETDWMARYFFSGGIMPSNHLLLYFADQFSIDRHWVVNGRHYCQTSEHWLQNMDANEEKIMPIFERVYGPENALKFWSYWRIFFMAVAELFGQFDGEEWMVNHYLFSKKSS